MPRRCGFCAMPCRTSATPSPSVCVEQRATVMALEYPLHSKQGPSARPNLCKRDQASSRSTQKKFSSESETTRGQREQQCTGPAACRRHLKICFSITASRSKKAQPHSTQKPLPCRPNPTRNPDPGHHPKNCPSQQKPGCLNP